ncbi:tyrosine decarboxylase-like [Schistocerca piceifrons]|uniref:tyrosine decarboxylase-like n=1 Tax=Schistocerca piceifrons TaxID=274613 RepID=UPI001F5EA8AE|nr:tyrosine decarboxylase-like [Schistocerca piceifrons]
MCGKKLFHRLLGSASENIFAAIMAARYQAIKLCLEDKENYNFSDEWDVLKNLVSYTSKAAHSSIEKGAKMACLRLRILDVDEKCSLRGDTLQQAIEKDLQLGLIPCCVVATLGSTGEAAFDNLKEIAMVCRKYPLIWLHVDAAYGGSSFVCREFRYLLSGIEDAHSINVNPNKWFLVNFDCNCIWLKDYQQFIEALSVNPLYLEHEWMDETVNFHDWGTPLSRRFRVLKLWFVMRTYGIKGLQHYIRRHCHLASLFESLVRKDSRFEVMNDVKFIHISARNFLAPLSVMMINDDFPIHNKLNFATDSGFSLFLSFVFCYELCKCLTIVLSQDISMRNQLLVEVAKSVPFISISGKA